jgi:signal transduction histidine kinase
LRRFRSTLFWHLVLGMVIVSVLAVGVTTAFLYARFASMDSGFRESTLRTFARSLAQDLHAAGGVVPGSIPYSTAQSLTTEGGSFAIVSQGGGVLAGSKGVSAAFVPVEDVGERYFTLPKAGDQEPIYGFSLRVDDVSPPLFVQVAFPANHVLFDSVLEEFIGDIAWIWLPFVFFMLATNVIVARIALKPLSQAAQQAEAIGPGSVTMRLSEGRMPRDILALVRAVNHALDRLQQGYRAMEEFVGDVAHELRTPLAIIKAQLSVSDAPIARVLGSDFARMERLVQQLLDRVRLGGLHFEPEDLVDLSEVARDAAGSLAPLTVMSNRSIEVVDAETPIYVSGARDYIFRALRNLIENAVEHTRPHTTVTVIVSDSPSITVLDRGPGFPAAKLDPLTRRQEELRSESSGGVGLGLSIVERTMMAHRGRLELSNRADGGASATLHFCRRGEPPSAEMSRDRHENDIFATRNRHRNVSGT